MYPKQTGAILTRPRLSRPPGGFSNKIGQLLIALFVSCWPVDAWPEEIDFDKQVAPILASKCLKCHSGSEPEGGLNLGHRQSALAGGESGQAIVSKDLEASLLIQRVLDKDMPPKRPLVDADRETLVRWIREGATWGADRIDPFAVTTSSRAGYDWWSFQPLRSVQTPPGNDWGRNEIDQFVLRKLRANGLTPSPEADPRALARRLSFDLIGMPPEPAWVDGFVADSSEAAYVNLVDKLLASKHYGERWGRHWLDVVRYGESDGFERNNPRRNAWHYRDWVIRALNSDMPYDRFVQMQLVGDQLSPGADGAAATGFWVAGVHNTVVGGSKRMKQLARQDEIEEVLATIAQTFLGLTINCGRCHEHKYDPVTQREYYQLASAISGLKHGERREQSAAASAKLAELQPEASRLAKQAAEMDGRVRGEIIANRKQGDIEVAKPPMPFARWEFDKDLRDSVGDLHGRAFSDAKVENGALTLDGDDYVVTAPLNTQLEEKTLAAWVQLDSLDQRGGAAISVETPNGIVFDAIVFGERQPQRWMAGSNNFVRTDAFKGAINETETASPVHVAIVYAKDGTIAAYRNGEPYGSATRKAPLQVFQKGLAEITFGLRHKPAQGRKFLRGSIHQASLYDRALSAHEVAVAAGNLEAQVSEQMIVERLTPHERSERKLRLENLKNMRAELARLQQLANMTIYTLTPGPGVKTQVLLRGDPASPGETVAAGGVAALKGPDADFGLKPDANEAERRRSLSNWITSGDNAQFTRVMANRIWHYHFGSGLVDTPNDFGFNGGRPSHPDMLEWLAGTLRDDGYRLKSLHRRIVLSSTYRQSSRIRPDAAKLDASNRLLWRMTPRRLEGEAIRDAMLVVAGKLNKQLGGESFEDVKTYYNSGTTYYEPIDVDGDAFFRRTVYRFNPRGGRSALLDTFDCPDSAATTPRRAITTTPLQALSLLNNVFVLRMSEYFAARVKESSDSAEAQVIHAWRLSVNREPTRVELEASLKLMDEHGLAALCRGLFNATEFVVVE